MIETWQLTKRFDQFTAVAQVNLAVAEGEVLALLGPNGAGKTTTVRMLAAILKPSAGFARIAGYDSVADARTVRHLVGVLTEFPGLYPRMTGGDYLDFFGQLQGLSRTERQDRAGQLLRRFQLWDERQRRIGEYSKGMKQKLTLVRAMLHDPPILFLDEPTSAMDPQSARLVRDSILNLRAEQRTILICTHNLTEAEELADRIAIIRQGQIIAEGSPAELKQRLLGDPVFEVRLGQPLNGLVSDLDDMISVMDFGDNWIRYVTPDPGATNPLLLQRLARQGTPVITLSEVSRTLEEVYLRIVEANERVTNEERV